MIVCLCMAWPTARTPFAAHRELDMCRAGLEQLYTRVEGVVFCITADAEHNVECLAGGAPGRRYSNPFPETAIHGHVVALLNLNPDKSTTNKQSHKSWECLQEGHGQQQDDSYTW